MNSRPAHFRRNFTFGVLNGTFFMTAMAFLSGSTILPVFISKLTDSRVWIGIFAHIEWFGWLAPQILAAVFLAHKKKILYFYNGLSIIRLFLFGMTVFLIFAFIDNYQAILISFGITFTLYSIASGMAGVAFTEIVGKIIPLNKRGSFFGLRMFSGGLLAALGGLFVKQIMKSFPFPYDFAYICSVSWILILLGLICFALIKEREAGEFLEYSGPRSLLKKALGNFKNDGNFRKLCYSRAWVNTALMATPFYVIFSAEYLKAPEWMAGIYLTAGMIGYLASNLLWGWLSNHVSNKMVIVFSGLFRVIPPIIAFGCYYFYLDPYIFAIVFVLLGMAESGIDMGYMTYILEIAPEKGRILSIGLFQTLIAPTVFFSGIGGWLSEILSLKWLFAAVFVTTLVSFIISTRLHEPRIRVS